MKVESWVKDLNSIKLIGSGLLRSPAPTSHRLAGTKKRKMKTLLSDFVPYPLL